jgi:hypothetical protein
MSSRLQWFIDPADILSRLSPKSSTQIVRYCRLKREFRDQATPPQGDDETVQARGQCPMPTNEELSCLYSGGFNAEWLGRRPRTAQPAVQVSRCRGGVPHGIELSP